MGECDINLKECFNNSGKWVIDKDFALLDAKKRAPKENPVKGFVYLQVKFVEENKADKSGAQPLRKDLMGTKGKEATPEDLAVGIKGSLFVNIINGRNLKIGDSTSSDALCFCKFLGKTKTKTEKITSLNPTWGHKGSFPVELKESENAPLCFEVFDWDVLKDDLLGTCQIPMERILKVKNKWSFNESLPLLDPEPPKDAKDKVVYAGSIYVQCKFVEEGAIDSKPMAPVKEEEMKVQGKNFALRDY